MGARVGFSIERMKMVDDPILNGLHDAAVCSRWNNAAMRWTRGCMRAAHFPP